MDFSKIKHYLKQAIRLIWYFELKEGFNIGYNNYCGRTFNAGCCAYSYGGIYQCDLKR